MVYCNKSVTLVVDVKFVRQVVETYFAPSWIINSDVNFMNDFWYKRQE
jgi:hypothetical protein